MKKKLIGVILAGSLLIGGAIFYQNTEGYKIDRAMKQMTTDLVKEDQIKYIEDKKRIVFEFPVEKDIIEFAIDNGQGWEIWKDIVRTAQGIRHEALKDLKEQDLDLDFEVNMPILGENKIAYIEYATSQAPTSPMLLRSSHGRSLPTS